MFSRLGQMFFNVRLVYNCLRWWHILSCKCIFTLNEMHTLCAKKVKVLEKSWKMITRLIEVRERCFCCCFCLGINPLFTLAAVEQFPCSARFFVSFSSVFARSMESWHLTKSSTIHHKLLDRFLCCPLFCNTWRHTALLVIGYFKCLLKIGQLE